MSSLSSSSSNFKADSQKKKKKKKTLKPITPFSEGGEFSKTLRRSSRHI